MPVERGDALGLYIGSSSSDMGGSQSPVVNA